MKVYILNDTSSFHAGSKAAVTYLKQEIRAKGHEIVGTQDYYLGEQINCILMSDCDCVVINGEGTFRNYAAGEDKDRIGALMKAAYEAKERGKKVCLVNALWCNMGHAFDDTLRMMDDITVREPMSKEEMEACGVSPRMSIDLSYFAPVSDWIRIEDWAARPFACGWVHNGKLGFSAKNLVGEKVSLGGIPEKAEISEWAYVVNKLRDYSTYITGQHHGVYAACKAGVPFVPIKVNTHKLEGLFKWAGVNIPIVDKIGDAYSCHWEECYKLFEWMKKQPRWEFRA